MLWWDVLQRLTVDMKVHVFTIDKRLDMFNFLEVCKVETFGVRDSMKARVMFATDKVDQDFSNNVFGQITLKLNYLDTKAGGASLA